MEWTQLFRRLEAALSPKGCLAIVEIGSGPNPWDEQLRAAVREFSTNRQFQPYDLTTELIDLDLFVVEGTA